MHGAVTEPVDVAREDVAFVHVAELRGPGQRRVLRLFDRRDAAEFRIDRP